MRFTSFPVLIIGVILILCSKAQTGSCPANWREFTAGNRCYFIGSENAKVKGNNYEAKCKAIGGSPLTVDSMDVVRFFNSIPQNELKEYWVGLWYNNRAWVNAKGQKATWTHWQSDMPQYEKDCVHAERGSKDEKWKEEDCSADVMMVCEKDGSASATTTTTSTCGDVYRRSDFGFEYKYHSVSQLFGDANQTCQTEGGYLVSIHSQDEWKFVQGLVCDMTASEIWMGMVLKKKKDRSSAYWVDGSTKDFTLPDSDFIANTDATGIPVRMENYNDVWKWNDCRPDESKSFICKRAVITTTPATTITTAAPPTTSTTTAAPPTTSATTAAPPTTSATTAAPPTTSATIAAPPTTSATTAAPPTTSATTAASATTPTTIAAPPTTSTVTAASATTSTVIAASPSTSTTTAAPPTTSATTAAPPATSRTTAASATTSATTAASPATSATTAASATTSATTAASATTSTTTAASATTSSTTATSLTTSNTKASTSATAHGTTDDMRTTTTTSMKATLNYPSTSKPPKPLVKYKFRRKLHIGYTRSPTPCQGEEWAYSNLTGNCYMFFRAALPQTKAVTACRSIDSELLSIQNKDEEAIIDAILGYDFSDHWTIGKRDQSGNITYNGKEITYGNWLSEELLTSTKPGEEVCLALVKNLFLKGIIFMNWKWDTRPCSERKSFVCQHTAKRCPSLPSAPFVTPNPPKPFIGLTINYACQIGYRMPNYRFRYLEWKAKKPTVSVTSEALTAWRAMKPNITEMPTMKYKCLYPGRWSNGSLAPCEPISCSHPLDVKYAKRNSSDRIFPAFIEYKCEHGYHFREDNSSTKVAWCGPDKEWIDIPPDCEPVECGPFPRVGNASANSAKTLYKDVVVWSCLAGYMFPEDRSVKQWVRCRENYVNWQIGRWNVSHLDDCVKLECLIPPIPANTTRHAFSTEYKAEVRYTCLNDKLEFPSGDTELWTTCAEEARWKPPVPQCRKKPKKLHLKGKKYLPPAKESPDAKTFGTMAIAIMIGLVIVLVLIDLRTCYHSLQFMKWNLRLA